MLLTKTRLWSNIDLHKLNTFLKYVFLGWFGGSTYAAIEVLYRGYSHWTMIVLAAWIFIILGSLNKILPWELGLVQQVIIGTIIVTFSEFCVGYVVNIKLGWNVWDYSNEWGHVLGQICPQFILAWIPLVLIAIVIDDVIRWKFFKEEKPRYKLV